MIRSCLAKKDNKGVHKGTGCLASSQLNPSCPALLAWAQEHTQPLQYNVSLGTLCSSAAEHFIPVFSSSSQRTELSLISHHLHVSASVHMQGKAEAKPHLSVPWMCLSSLSPACLSLLSHPISQPCQSRRRKGLYCWKETEGLCFKPEK